ncbi:hypothetical protein [Aggregatibacter actinomycetemcomitans]|uniref:hypothetical protein n=1 Tax=Aggregatibacter actinomycetemcomitans TaxID=714 RepID=UPI001E58089B|nr:hypothetical protein [Aggregatibacter actinomycetemcomitans]
MGNLTKEQKIIAYALIVLGLILLYLLSAAILVALLYPFSGKSLSRLSGSFSVIRQYFDVWLPFKALSKGFIAETIRAFLYAIFLSSTIGSVVYIMVKRAQEKRNIYGKAKWSVEADIRKNNLRAEKGIIVGRNKKGLLKFGGQEFVSVGAPTRSGKGVTAYQPEAE